MLSPRAPHDSPSVATLLLPAVVAGLVGVAGMGAACDDAAPAAAGASDTREQAILVGAECWDDGLCRVGCSPADVDCPAAPPDRGCQDGDTSCDGLCDGLQAVVCGRIDLSGHVTDPLADAAADILARWPNAGAAHDDLDVNGRGIVWDWAHKKKSVDGFGPTMATVNHRAGGEGDGWDSSEDDVKADGDLFHPSLLFFDRTGDASTWRTWPLIGFGYFFDFDPCHRPSMQCVGDNDWFIHEAGYHHSFPTGDGGMTLADDSDLCDVPGSGGILQSGCGDAEHDCSEVDVEGCEDIDDVDIELHVGKVKHGRGWDLHMWLRNGQARPTITRFDPDDRWANAPSGRIALDNERFFFFQDADACCGGDCH